MERGNEKHHMKNGTLIQPLGKLTRSGHIQETLLLAPATELLYVKEAIGWVSYTS